MYERVYGSDYKPGMDIKDIAKIVRQRLKKAYPGFKFSVRIERYSGGQSMRADMVEAPEDFKFYQVNPSYCGGYNPNNYNEIYETPVVQSDEFNDIMAGTKAAMNDFNYDGSEIQVDYFDVNFYAFEGVGSKIYYRMEEEKAALIDKVINDGVAA